MRNSTIIAACVATGLLAACDDGKETAVALQELAAYYDSRGLDFSWEATKIEAHDAEILVEIIVRDQSVADQIKVRSRMDQMAIARLGCPNPDEPWNGKVARGLRVSVELVTEAGVLVKSTCKR